MRSSRTSGGGDGHGQRDHKPHEHLAIEQHALRLARIALPAMWPIDRDFTHVSIPRLTATVTAMPAVMVGRDPNQAGNHDPE